MAVHGQKEFSLVSAFLSLAFIFKIPSRYVYLDKCRLPGYVEKQVHIWHFQFLVVEA